MAPHARRHVVAHVEDRLRIGRDVGQQLAHRVRVGRGHVDVAAPAPAARLVGHERVQRGGLRVVDEGHVPAADQLARVHLVVAPPGVPLLVAEVLGRALQRVVHQLGRVEELLAAVDDLPLDVEPHVLHERHEGVEDLAHAAAERGGRDVHDARPRQGLGELADLLDEVAPDDVRVVREGLRSDGDRLEHARESSCVSRAAACRAAARPASRAPDGARRRAGRRGSRCRPARSRAGPWRGRSPRAPGAPGRP